MLINKLCACSLKCVAFICVVWGQTGHASQTQKNSSEFYKIARTEQQTNYMGEDEVQVSYDGQFELEIRKTPEGRKILFQFDYIYDCGDLPEEKVDIDFWGISETISAPVPFNEECAHIVFYESYGRTNVEYLFCENDERFSLFNIDIDTPRRMPNRLVFDKGKDREDKRTVGMSN